MQKDNKAVATTTQSKDLVEYGAESANLAQLLADEMEGLSLTFDRIKIPAGGGLAYEVPSDNPDNPDAVKEFSAVILYHHPVHSYYKEKYTGGNTPPDCSSMNGISGINTDGIIKDCKACEYAEFGSGDNGGKACKQKRRVYILRAGEALPNILSLPTGSLGGFSKYVMRLLSKGKKPGMFVTKFTLKKEQNSGGINYSQAVLSAERQLTDAEAVGIARLAEQVKAFAGKVVAVESNDD